MKKRMNHRGTEDTERNRDLRRVVDATNHKQ